MQITSTKPKTQQHIGKQFQTNKTEIYNAKRTSNHRNKTRNITARLRKQEQNGKYRSNTKTQRQNQKKHYKSNHDGI